MNVVEKILKTKESLDGKQIDFNEIIRVNNTVVSMADGEIFCNINYTIEIGNGEDESWDCKTIYLPRLLTDEELIKIGNIEQHNIDCGIHKSTYYDIESRRRKIQVTYTEPI